MPQYRKALVSRLPRRVRDFGRGSSTQPPEFVPGRHALEVYSRRVRVFIYLAFLGMVDIGSDWESTTLSCGLSLSRFALAELLPKFWAVKKKGPPKPRAASFRKSPAGRDNDEWKSKCTGKGITREGKGGFQWSSNVLRD